ncbi:MAG: hypothetical protein AAGB31_15545, partial [Bdellovibrio sp.]
MNISVIDTPVNEVNMISLNNRTLSRWTPFFFKNGAAAKNRVVIPPMASGTATLLGAVTSNT